MQLFGLKTSGRGRAPQCLVPGLQTTTSPRGLRAARPCQTDSEAGARLWGCGRCADAHRQPRWTTLTSCHRVCLRPQPHSLRPPYSSTSKIKGVVGSNPASRATNSSQINGLASQELARFSLCRAIGVLLRDVGTRLDAIRSLGDATSTASFECAIRLSLDCAIRVGQDERTRTVTSAFTCRRSIGVDAHAMRCALGWRSASALQRCSVAAMPGSRRSPGPAHAQMHGCARV